MELRFIPITKENLPRAAQMQVGAGQEHTVETVEQSWQEARRFRVWRPVLIADGDTDIGFAMYGLWKREGRDGRVWLDRFLIDHRQQGRGYAKAVLPPLLERIRQEYGYPRLYLSVYEDNAPAIALYERFGFAFNGELDINGELVMVREY